MKKGRLFCLLIFLTGSVNAISFQEPEPEPFYLWEFHLEKCHHPLGVCSGSPPP